jgi:integrase
MLPTSKPKLKASTRAAYKDLLGRVIVPSLASLRIVDVQSEDVARLHGKWRDSPYTANRAVSLISSIWAWAARARKEVSTVANPAKDVERNRERRRERYLSTDEFGKLGEALREAETIGLPWTLNEGASSEGVKRRARPENQRTRLDPYAIAAIRLLMLTGARLGEILSVKRKYVDLERGIIHLPDSKTGAKPIYLSAAAQVLLQGLPRLADNPYLIPGEIDGAPRADLKKPWRAVTRAAGLEGLRIHDLRHSFASLGASASLGLHIIGKLLGHAQPATTARYAHLDADPMRRAVETIGATISAAINGDAAGNVVPLEPGRSPRRIKR